MIEASDFDAVVVGAGAGGGAAAWRMTKRGWRVLLLDAGPAFDPSTDYGLSRDDWERQGFMHKPGSLGATSIATLQTLDPTERELRSWSLGQGLYNHGERREVSGAGYHHVRGIGGSTLHFVGESHRLHPRAMRMRSRFGVGADWPLAYAELEPFYREAEELLGVAGPADTGARWRSAPYPQPAHPLSLASHWLGRGAAALGLSWQANPRCALSMPLDGRPACNYCGGCTHGCPRRDKGSTDVTFIAKARASGRCEVRAGLQVRRIEAEAKGRVQAIMVSDAGAGGRMLRIPVRRLVLACGAVETPRLLLLQRGARHARGLANDSHQVGRNFMESVTWISLASTDARLMSFGGLPADSICWDYNAPDAVPGQVGGFRLSAAVHEAGMVGAIAHAQRAVPGFGRAHKEQMRQLLGSVVAVGATGESLPHARSFVDLDPGRRDSGGQALARIHSHVDDATRARLRFMAQRCRALLRAGGATRLVEEFGTYDFFSAAHVFGTCRMGRDPRESVVDAQQRAHGWSNLWICDASVFPSSGGGEAPSLTIEALTLRAVDRMV